jgi:hypothetical protein
VAPGGAKGSTFPTNRKFPLVLSNIYNIKQIRLIVQSSPSQFRVSTWPVNSVIILGQYH